MTLFPPSLAAWWSLVQLWLGALAGYLIHPLAWLAVGPFGFLGWVSSRAAGRGYDATRADGGRWGMLGIRTEDLRWAVGPLPWASPLVQGIAAARMVQAAVLVWPTWAALLRVPLLGFKLFLHLVDGGASRANGERWREAAPIDSLTSRASWLWFAAFLPGSLALTGWLFGLWRWRRGGGR